MSAVIMNAKLTSADTTALAMNRGKLMKLAEGIKTKKKPTNKKSFNFKKEPSYANIEHLVYGSYRPRTSLAPASPTDRGDQDTEPSTGGHAASTVTSYRGAHLNQTFILPEQQEEMGVTAKKNLPVRNGTVGNVTKKEECTPTNGILSPKRICACPVGSSRCECVISTVQSIRKISVSSSKPARPTVSTKVTVTVNTDTDSARTIAEDTWKAKTKKPVSNIPRSSVVGTVKCFKAGSSVSNGNQTTQNGTGPGKPSKLRQPLRSTIHVAGSGFSTRVTSVPRATRTVSCPGPSGTPKREPYRDVKNVTETVEPLSEVSTIPDVSKEENGVTAELAVPPDGNEDFAGSLSCPEDPEVPRPKEEEEDGGVEEVTEGAKQVRRRKASSSPVFMDPDPQLQRDAEAKRSWSQLYCDKDLVRFINSKAEVEDRSLDSSGERATVPRVVAPLVPESATPSAIAGSVNLLARFASMRSQPPRSPVENVLHKFRKSFSVRFYKKTKGLEDNLLERDANRSRFYTSAEEGLDIPCSTSPDPDHTVFRFGPLVWRSSKEKKDRAKKGSQSSLTTVTCPSTPVHCPNPEPAPRRRAMSGSCQGDAGPSSSTPKRTLTASVYFTGSTEYSPVCVRRGSRLRRFGGTGRLRRSVSQPVELGKAESCAFPDHEATNGSSSSDNEGSDRVRSRDQRAYGEALWDHVTMDHEELGFKAGDVVEILDTTDPDFWFGVIGDRSGWFPASFVRLRVNQEEGEEAKVRANVVGSDQIRTNVIMEIVSTERDFVRHLRDVIQGYLKQMRKRPDMFSEQCVSAVFGNIEQIHEFQSKFLEHLETAVDWERPHRSNIGSCFTEHKEGFQVYSEYCNNHPQAVKELQDLYAIPKYAHFFEACRLLQDMIDISLDGFLLTPVQKICKYPLQLAELLKYTSSGHEDESGVREALDAMRGVARFINERKRRMECLERLAEWQTAVLDWEGPHLLERSSELIHTGEASKVSVAWSRDLNLFLFDHQLILCKRDLLKKSSYTYKGRLDLDGCEVVDVPDGRDAQSGISLKNAWKVFCSSRNKSVIFAVRTAAEKLEWLTAFESERRRVEEDNLQGFVVSESAKEVAMKNNAKSKRPKDKEKDPLVRGSSRSSHYMDRRAKSGSLPRSVILSTTKKKNSGGWFHFGSNKKTKR